MLPFAEPAARHARPSGLRHCCPIRSAPPTVSGTACHAARRDLFISASMQTLKTRDLIALGFMTFALFLGAGNIIFPPMVGQGAGEHAAAAATGFLLTGVGLPLLTVVALARVGGGLDALTSPVGRKAGMVLGLLIYLIDRKSTRLNSSHLVISYAVFCLKKK